MLGILAVSAFVPRLGARGFRRVVRGCERIARRPALAVLGCMSLAGMASAAVALLVHRPEPRVTDEFSYLLAADTFAHGRLANPPHPLWEHFESIHLLQQPTYATKYPPGQGLLLAAGQVLGGEPLLGVWLGAAFLIGSVTWMLQGWLPARWALLGGLLALFQFGIATYWTQSYWGGALAASGGALLFGGLSRLVRYGRARDAAAMGSGFVLLALTRPFEGLVVSIPPTIAAMVWIIRRACSPGLRHALLPAITLACVTGAGLGWLSYYNGRVTGDALLLPYRLHDTTYEVAPPFLLESERKPPPHFRDDTLRDFYLRLQVQPYRQQRTWNGFWKGVAEKARTHWRFYLGPFLTLPLLALPWVLRERRMWSVFAALGLLGLALLALSFNWAHYAAPATCLVVLVVVACLRRLAACRSRRERFGRSLAFWVLGVTLGLSCAQAATRGRAHAGDWSERRAELLDDLEREPGDHLVFVRYGPLHVASDEWVYNGADLATTKVLFARDLGEEANRRLLDMEASRNAWRLDVDFPGEPARLRSYP